MFLLNEDILSEVAFILNAQIWQNVEPNITEPRTQDYKTQNLSSQNLIWQNSEAHYMKVWFSLIPWAALNTQENTESGGRVNIPTTSDPHYGHDSVLVWISRRLSWWIFVLWTIPPGSHYLHSIRSDLAETIERRFSAQEFRSVKFPYSAQHKENSGAEMYKPLLYKVFIFFLV